MLNGSFHVTPITSHKTYFHNLYKRHANIVIILTDGGQNIPKSLYHLLARIKYIKVALRPNQSHKSLAVKLTHKISCEKRHQRLLLTPR